MEPLAMPSPALSSTRSSQNKNLESFSAVGNVEILEKKVNYNLNLNFEDFNLGVLSSLGGDVLSDIRGFASGKASITGDSNLPDINGRLFLANAGIGIPYLNVDYAIQNQAVVDVTESKFIFRNSTLTDSKYKTEGAIFGTISHKNFGDWKLDLNINSNRLLALDTKDSEDSAYYGVAFIDGEATIKGPTNGLVINVNAKSEKGTAIKIPINDSEGISSKNYIHFVTPEEKYNIKKGTKTVARNYNGLELEFDLDITPNAEIEVILDRNSGHGMKGKGFGSLLFKINTLGKFNMWGDFQAYQGEYNFKYGGLINRKFDVKKGGSISWEGDPLRAILNLEAVYKTTANPAILVDNSTSNQKVDVEVVIGIKGNLSNPEPDFNFNFPGISNVIKSEIQTKLEDKDIRQKQALVLLSTGNFLSSEGLNSTAVINNVYQKFGDIFGDIFNDKDGKIKVGVDIVSADRTIGSEADGRVGVTINYKINDRITFNGKAGIPVGGINQSAIVGNAEIQYRVNEDGTLNLRFFNRENEVNYIGQGIGYTQGGGISYEVDFDTFQELLNRIFKNQKIEKTTNKKEEKQTPDSEVLPEFINFSDSKKKKETLETKDEKPPNE